MFCLLYANNINEIIIELKEGIELDEKHGKVYRNVDDPVVGQPETCDELLHKYGTYEIQPTGESGNEFPEIAQGLSEKDKKSSIDKNRQRKMT